MSERARRTDRLEGIVHHLGLALGGRPGAVFAARLMLPVSNDTLLRVVRRRARCRTDLLTPTQGIALTNAQNFAFPTDGPLRIVGDESRYRIELPSDILFDFDRSELRPEAGPLLEAVREHFETNRVDQILVSGHTDAKGTPEHNYVLSVKRATAVCDWLKEALDRPFTSCIGRGEDEPLVAETRADGSDDPEGRQRNRRVQIAVVVYPDAKALLDRAREQAQGAGGGQP